MQLYLIDIKKKKRINLYSKSLTNVIGSGLMSDKYASGLTCGKIFSMELLNDSSDIFFSSTEKRTYLMTEFSLSHLFL